MIQDQRIIFSDNGTNSDWSIELNDYRADTKTLAYVAGEDYLYVATDLPFNHKYFDISTVNDQACAVSVDIWFGREWVPAVDVVDRTASAGVSLAKSGIIEWKTNRVKGWDSELDSEDVEGVTKVGLYNMYWARFSWNADTNASTAFNYLGNRFSSDDVLYSYYPDLANDSVKSAFETGKTTWEEQHFMASEIVIRDLKTRNIIRSTGQILDHDLFVIPTVHKSAELIYKALGRAYDEDRNKAREYYDEALNVKFYRVDQNFDANLSAKEKSRQTGFFRR